MPEYARQGRGGDENESFFCRFTFGQFFAILLLEVFTLFFVFYLGARYGREFLGLGVNPGDLIGEASRNEPQRIQTTTDPEVSAMARDLVAKAKTPELKERIANMLGTGVGKRPPPPPSPTEKLPSHAAEEGVLSEPSTTGESGVGETPPAETLGEVRPREEVSPVVTRGGEAPQGAVRIKSGESSRYSVQIGSYPQLAEANSAVERWKAKGYGAFMMIADIPDRGRWYRVRIGAFAARDDAVRYMQELKDREGVDALVVLNEQ